MSIWLHTAILATGLAATITIALAGAAIYDGKWARVGVKADRLAVTEVRTGYVTVETRGVGVSELSRVAIDPAN